MADRGVGVARAHRAAVALAPEPAPPWWGGGRTPRWWAGPA